MWAVLLNAAAAAAAQTVDALRTPAELSSFQRYTSHDEMWDYLLALRAQSTELRLGSYGETREGRHLPLAILSRPLIAKPAEAALLGRPVVLLGANVHGDERTFRESLLILLRELATPGTPENRLLDQMVILVAPQLNPDGFEATERGRRGNAWGIDLNRDYIKLEQPETASFVGGLLNQWLPHLFVDGHNGGLYPYNVTYQCPSHVSPDPRLTALCDEEIFPAMDHALYADGFRSWYFNVGAPDEQRWTTGGHQARIGRNYGGFANTVAILLESPAWQDMRTGVSSGRIALRSVLEYVQRNGDRLVATVDRARLETITMGLAAQGEVAIEMRYEPEDRRVSYELGVGEGPERRTVVVTDAELIKKPVATRTRRRPYAYILPRDAVAAIEMLQRHNITIEQLQDSVQLEVEAYTIDEVTYVEQYNHASAVQVRVGEVLTMQRTFPRGTYVVPTGQVLGRVVAHMLEPETDDNVIYWNTMDAWLPRPQASPAAADPEDEPVREESGPALVPIFKLMQPVPLPSTTLRR